MPDDKQIQKWLKEGTITKKQADKMLADETDSKKETQSNRMITSVSTIGAILLGVGALLFISSNWEKMSNLLKIAILVVATFGSYFVGYLFKYQKKNLPKVGASLFFLGALLFGASIMLIAQMYNINANSHTLVLIWLLGILPLIYAFESVPIAGLAAFLFLLWIGLFQYRTLSWGSSGDMIKLPLLYLVSGILLFGIGGMHYISERLKGVARTYRIAGLKVAMISLFLLTFKFYTGVYDGFNYWSKMEISSQFTIGFVIFALLAILIMVINLFFNLTRSQVNYLENAMPLGLVALALIFYFFTPVNNLYTILFNLVFAAIIFALLWEGYQREDMTLVNMGMGWLAALVVFRYYDFFWDLLPRSLFFMVGGLILVLGGIALEKKRRDLKSKFKRRK